MNRANYRNDDSTINIVLVLLLFWLDKTYRLVVVVMVVVVVVAVVKVMFTHSYSKNSHECVKEESYALLKSSLLSHCSSSSSRKRHNILTKDVSRLPIIR